MPTLPLLLLLATHAQALGLERELLDWSSFGHTAAAEDAQAQGPALLHAGPGERVGSAVLAGQRRLAAERTTPQSWFVPLLLQAAQGDLALAPPPA